MEFLTDFECANATPIEVGERLVRFVAEARRSPQPMWFYFRLADIPDGEIEFRLENAVRCLGGITSFPPVRPVLSYDGKNWERMARGQADGTTGVFTFRHSFSGSDACVAFCYPYTYSDVLDFVGRLDESPHCQVGVIGQSAHGRDLHHALITDHADPEGKPFGLWMTARHHAGETPGAFTMEGFVQGVLADTEAASWVRENVAVNIVPAVDVDNCAEGGYGKNEAPVDFNRDYLGPSQRPEVAAIRRAIAQWARSYPYQLFLDMHAPTPADPNYAFLVWREHTTDEFRQREECLLQAITRNAPPTCEFSLERCRDLREEGEPRDSKAAQWRDYGAMGLTLEMAYHETAQGHVLTREAYTDFGRGLVGAVREYLMG